jgi:hypothetical protein
MRTTKAPAGLYYPEKCDILHPAFYDTKGITTMDYQTYRPQRNPNRCSWMENVSVMLGILGILSAFMVYPALIGGSMAIVFALLSKGGRTQYHREGAHRSDPRLHRARGDDLSCSLCRIDADRDVRQL